MSEKYTSIPSSNIPFIEAAEQNKEDRKDLNCIGSHRPENPMNLMYIHSNS
jgi:hypothetical protein